MCQALKPPAADVARTVGYPDLKASARARRAVPHDPVIGP
jgi:hypothetical protein